MPQIAALWSGHKGKRLCLAQAKAYTRAMATDYLAACREECPVDTGFLRDSHRIHVVSPYTFQVTVRASYASYVHDGTTYIDANPWMERASKKLGLRRRGKFAI